MITVDRGHFGQAIQFASKVIERRHTIPILSAVKAVANGGLRLEATDLDNFAVAELPYNGDHESFCISEPRGLRSAINVAAGKSVTFEPGEKSRVTVSCGSLDSEMFSLPVDDHPGAESIAEELFGSDLGAAELRQISRIVAAISTEETRYYLNGISVRKVGDWLYRFCATDGHRLMWVNIPLPSAVGEIADDTIIPRRFVEIALEQFSKSKDVSRLSYGYVRKSNEPEATLAVDKKGMPRIAISGRTQDIRYTLTGKLIDGTYPDVNRVIPQECKHFIRTKRGELAKAIKALTPLSTGRTRAVKITTTTAGLIISLQSPDIGNSNFKIAAEHNVSGDFYIGFNAQYLLDMCAALYGDEIELRFDDPGSPTMVVDPADTEFGAVLMPMRV